MTDADGKTQTFPLNASGSLEFCQRLISNDEGASFAARHYDVAKSQVAGGSEQEALELAGDRRTLAVLLDEEGLRRRALDGAITHAELEMLQTPGDLLTTYGLLPQKQVRVGERWRPTDEAIRRLLNFETVGVNETKIELVSIERGLAMMKLTGTIRGMVQGAVSDTRLNGDLRYDLNWNRINWLKLVLDDDRAAGPASPAVRSAVELRMLVEPMQAAPPLDKPAVAQLQPSDMHPRALLLKHDSPNGFRFLHEAAWVPLADQHRRSIFRLVHRDQAVAQCHIARLPDSEPGKQTSLEEFQRDIQSALGDKFGRMVETNQIERRDGVRVLKAIAEGTIQEVPIRWVYYHLADGRGARASLVFTIDVDNVERFDQYDRVMVGSLAFSPPVTMPASEGRLQTATPHPSGTRR